MHQADYDWVSRLQERGPSQTRITISANPQWVSVVTNRMEPYKNFPEKFRPALEGIADYITKTAIPKVFKEEGPGWRRLSKRTQAERKASGFNPQHPILIRTGDLIKELTDRSHPKHVEIIKTGQNARIIIGGSSEKYVRNQLGNDLFKIPQRPMMPGTGNLQLGQRDQENINQIITEKIQESMKKHG